MSKKERKTYFYAVLFSLLLHALLFLLLNFFDLLGLSAPELRAEEPIIQPIVLELENPAPPEAPPAPQQEPVPPLPNKLYDVMENPNADNQKPVNSNLLAEKSSVSAAPDRGDPGKALAPRSEAEPQQFNDLTREEQQESQQQPEEAADLKGTENVFAMEHQRLFSKDLVAKQLQKKSVQQPVEQSTENKKSAPLTQKDFEAELIGEPRLSTYAWDWAPWWLAFKRKIFQYWYIPTAWQMGLISGYTVVSIKVSREGELMEYEILDHKGHPSLRESSENVLESTFPFKALPPDFPEKYLEIKFVMIYPDLKELFRKQQ